MQKSKSYLDAEKGSFAENDNNKTFPIRLTLEQGVAVNEGVPTDESPTALEVVPTAKSPVTNEGVPTDESPPELKVLPTAEFPIINEDIQTNESPTEVVGEPTAESPNPQKSRDKREIRRNYRNLIVALGHIANEGDESQVNSLSPSNIDIQNPEE